MKPSEPMKIIPIRMTADEKTEAMAACEVGETLSSFVRDAVRERIKRKWKQRKRRVSK